MKKLTFAVALALVLGACSQADDDATTPVETTTESTTAEPTATETTSEEPTEEPTEDETTQPSPEPTETTEEPVEADLPEFVSGEAQSEDPFALEAQMFPVESRIGLHDGYDRLVVEYTPEQDEPGWYSEGVVNVIYNAGRGDAVDIPGVQFLQVQVAGVRYPEGNEMDLDFNPEIPQGSVIQGVEISYPFEGMHEINIGLAEGSQYRVIHLTEPSRIVIDIKR